MACYAYLAAVVLCCCLYLSNGHSWIACTDYVEKNGDMFYHDKCRGYPRAANKKLRKNIVDFGEDSGYDFQPTEEITCSDRRNDRLLYDYEYPMAVYYPGQQVVLAHPMKNHGADEKCTNIYIPDSGSWIYRGERQSRTDPTFSKFKQHLVFDLGRSPLGAANFMSSQYPKPGFQNAPAFCLNIDKSLGTYSFNVPLDLKPGVYTFIWVWAFNNEEDLFTTCFEVNIVRNRAERNWKLLDNGFLDVSEPCGGATSNPLIEGVCNQPLDNENGDGTRGRANKSTSNRLILIFLTLVLQLIAFIAQ